MPEEKKFAKSGSTLGEKKVRTSKKPAKTGVTSDVKKIREKPVVPEVIQVVSEKVDTVSGGETEISDEYIRQKEAEFKDDKGKKPDRYFEAVGRRKTAVARVRLFTRAGDFTVNGKLYGSYFQTFELQKTVEDALQKMKLFGRFRVSAKVFGGGHHTQAEALRHGLARCLIKFNPDFRKRLKRAGYLKRDPRMKERKKFGLKKARRAPQWAKR